MSKTKHLALQNPGSQILELLQKSISQTNPAWFLYKSEVRTPLFLAESLTRLLEQLPHGKEMLKAGKKIKKLEDSLGAIEDYDSHYLLFSKNKNIKKEEADYFFEKRENAVNKLNEKLIKKDFYQELYHRLSGPHSPDFDNKLLLKNIKLLIAKEWKDCFGFYEQHKSGFDSMEDQVHEMRRKLRWISIYAQSLDGSIVLDVDKKKYPWEKKFITAAEIKSPYNIIPVKKDLEGYIHFNKKAFLALSFVVNSLGEIKDKGLQLEYLTRSIRKTLDLPKEKAQEMATKQLGIKYSESDLFKEAENLLHSFFIKYKIHDLLLSK